LQERDDRFSGEGIQRIQFLLIRPDNHFLDGFQIPMIENAGGNLRIDGIVLADEGFPHVVL
jgi:hypothetical protein